MKYNYKENNNLHPFFKEQDWINDGFEYRYKKGKKLVLKEETYFYVLSSNEIYPFMGGLPLIKEKTNDLNDFLKLIKEEKAQNIILKDLNQEDFDKVINASFEWIETLSLDYLYLTNQSTLDFSLLSKCSKLEKVEIKVYDSKVKLWNLKDNPYLKELTIIGLTKLTNQEGLKDSLLRKIKIKRKDCGLSDTNKPIIHDFSIFETLPNLKELDLFIGKKKNKEDDLISLAKLKKIELIKLPKNYFTFSQFAWLSSKLKNTQGIGCVYDYKFDKRIEKYVYTINGTRMAYEFKTSNQEGIEKYSKKFNDLIKQYQDEEKPPVK